MKTIYVKYNYVLRWMLLLIAGVVGCYELTVVGKLSVATLFDVSVISVAMAVTLVVVTTAVVRTSDGNIVSRIAIVVVAVMISAVITGLLGSMAVSRLSVLAVTVMSLSLFVAALVYAINILVADINNRDLRKERLERRASQLQLDLLQAYINPHFLFNCLNTIGGLVYESPQRTERYIDSLSSLLRYMLSCRSRRTVAVAEELRNMKHYVGLMEIRYGDEVRVEIDPRLYDCEFYICPGTLQLLVENAIKHNAHSAGKPLVVRIADDGDDIRVTNNLSPIEGAIAGKSTGVGYESLDRRLSDIGKGRIVYGARGDEYVVVVPKIYEDL